MKIIKLPTHGIEIQLAHDPVDAEDPPAGTITSGDLLEDDDEPVWHHVIDAILSIVLAHACAGIDVTTPAYLEGLETALDKLANAYA